MTEALRPLRAPARLPLSRLADWRRNLRALVAAQTLGAFNDNYFKMIVSLMAIEVGAGSSVTYLSLTSLVFVAPYLLFSGLAGTVVDHCDKKRVLMCTKALEIAIGILIVAGLVLGRLDVLTAILFLLVTQATFFSPAKYAILPELVPGPALAAANGLLEFSRYMAIILGSAAAGLLLGQWGAQPSLLGGVVFILALLGWGATLRIRSPRPAPSDPAIGSRPGTRIGQGLQRIIHDRELVPVVAATTWFDFMTTLVLMTVLLCAKNVMQLGDGMTGTLAAVIGGGAGIGGLLAGRLSGSRVELALLPVCTALGGAMLIALTVSTHSIALFAVLLLACGIFGGLCLVPLYAALQRWVETGVRGQVIASNNFLNMAGVLAASAALWFLHDGLGLSPVGILAVSGLLMLAAGGAMLALWPRARFRVSLWTTVFRAVLARLDRSRRRHDVRRVLRRARTRQNGRAAPEPPVASVERP
jgi:acyl-[acyl-carrier-protein]-phospholipid O-acyltransferase/long-chain-fatty-acid--[acyl-carrier-protein] ligase